MAATPTPKNEVALHQQGNTQVGSVFSGDKAFDTAQRVAKALAASTMVPTSYQNNVPNVLVALEMANRIGASPLMVMQNLNVIHGRPSWGSSFIIATINSFGSFGPLRFKVTGNGDDRTCIAYATEKATGEVLEGPPVSIAMAKKEGWYQKSGSKWPSMPDLMLKYRSAAFFGRLYAPEIMMGMHTTDEVEDFGRPASVSPAADKLNGDARPAEPIQEPTIIEPEGGPGQEPLI